MYFFWAILFVIAMGIGLPILAGISRGMDRFSFVVWRGLGLSAATGSIALFIAGLSGLEGIEKVMPQAFGIMLCFSLGFYFEVRSYASLPVAISQTIQKASVPMMVFLGFVFLGEVISFIEIALIFGLLCSICLVALSEKGSMSHLDGRPLSGVACCVGSLPFFALGFMCVAIVSREIHPLWTAFIIESGVLLFAGTALLVRKIKKGTGIEPIGLKKYAHLSVSMALTVIGIISLSMALASGPLGIVGAVTAATLPINMVVAHMLHSEKLKSIQYVGIVCTIAFVVGLHMAGK